MPELDTHALTGACFAVAQDAKWQRVGTASAQEVTELSRQLVQIATNHIEYLRGQDFDTNIVTRAIRYIGHHHAGPWGEDTAWFSTMLEVLIELACCNSEPTGESEPFYMDIEAGLARARATYE